MRSTWRPPGTAGGDEKKGDTHSQSAQAGIATQNSPAGGGELWQKTLCSHRLLARPCARGAQSEEEDEECLLKMRRTWIWRLRTKPNEDLSEVLHFQKEETMSMRARIKTFHLEIVTWSGDDPEEWLGTD